MNYDFAVISNVNKDLQSFLENPTEDKNLTLLFNAPPDNQSVYMCLVQRRYEGALKSEYIDLYLQLGGTNTYIMTARRDICGIHTTLKLSIPHNLHGAEPLHGRHLGMDRLSIGRIRSNSFNTNFYSCLDEELLVYLNRTQIVDNNEMLIQYKLNLLGSWKPYEMEVFLAERSALPEVRRSSIVEPSIYTLKSRLPEWDPFQHTYVMDFRNRVTIPSIKNLQLENRRGEIVLQFGRVGKDLFTMDFKSPITLFQSFCICLTRFFL